MIIFAEIKNLYTSREKIYVMKFINLKQENLFMKLDYFLLIFQK